MSTFHITAMQAVSEGYFGGASDPVATFLERR
jgi:hypothetical protein